MFQLKRPRIDGEAIEFACRRFLTKFLHPAQPDNLSSVPVYLAILAEAHSCVGAFLAGASGAG